ncbi:MAG TPA: hypothetical protein VGU68_17505, partial [Ktedonobacteraceae bacterium]|nr:hypothetical protein [Ktedonobacteraceae bacterium]
MTEQDEAHEQIIDHWTYQLEALLLQIAATAQENNIHYYIGGGLAIDLTFGGLSRTHEDIDFHPLEEDTQWWKDWFVSQGDIVSKDPDMQDYPYAFLLMNERHDYFADVYPVKINLNGTITVTVANGFGGRPWWKGKSWNEVIAVNYKGQKIIVESYKSVLKQKEEHYKWHGGKVTGKHLY